MVGDGEERREEIGGRGESDDPKERRENRREERRGRVKFCDLVFDLLYFFNLLLIYAFIFSHMWHG